MTHDCPICERRFGGTAAYDRHVDRRRDRCKTEAHLRRLGIVPDDDGIYRRAPIDPQPPLIDKRHVSRVAKRTRRPTALADVQPPSARKGGATKSNAPEPAVRLLEVAS